MILLIVVFVVLLCAGSLGLFDLLNKICWRESLHLIPFTICFGLVIGCACLTAVGLMDFRSSIYEVAYEDGRKNAEFEVKAENTNEEQRYDAYIKGFSDGYNAANDEYKSKIEAAPSASPTEAKPTNQTTSTPIIKKDNTVKENESAVPSMVPSTTNETASSYTVYYTDSGSVLHKDPDCSYLKKATNVSSADISQAPNRPLCSKCG